MKSLWVWLHFKAKQRALTFTTVCRSIYKLCIWICANLLIFQTIKHFQQLEHRIAQYFLLFSDGKVYRHQNPCKKRLTDNLNPVISHALWITDNWSAEPIHQRESINLELPESVYCFSRKKKKKDKKRGKKKFTFLSISFCSLNKRFVKQVTRTHYFCLYLA